MKKKIGKKLKITMRNKKSCIGFYFKIIKKIFFYLIIFCFLIFTACTIPSKHEVYKKKLLFKGKNGKEIVDLSYGRDSAGFHYGPVTFAVGKNRDIFIYDPMNNNVIKQFSFNGEVKNAIQLNQDIDIDNMIIIDDNTILCRAWNGFLIFLDFQGRIIKRFKLPPGGGSILSIFQYGQDIFLNYNYNNVQEVGLKYRLDRGLITIKKKNYSLWVETGSKYYTSKENYKETDVMKSDGSKFIKNPDPINYCWKSLGLDKDENLYLVFQIKQKRGNIQYIVRKYSPKGEKTAEFEILPYDYLFESHLIKMDRDGNVYILYVPDDFKIWEMYRYSS